MRICAEARTNPPQIIISWGSVPAGVPAAESYQIQRGELPPVTLSADTLSYTDTNVVAGELYTYQVSKQPNTDANGVVYIPVGGIAAGVALPLVESRGKLILIVDSDNAAGLSSELTRLTYDLAGDGWTVIRHDVSPTSSAPDVKALIQADYNNDPTNVKCVFLFGRIPVAMSGYSNPDGHHLRALPTDGYYGDMDGVWTDIADLGDDNRPGDGKFDAYNSSALPSAVELAVGRVDLRSMPTFSKSETELLRQYLDKDHNYRHKLFLALEQAIIDDHFGNYGVGDARNGWRNFPMFVGPTNVLIDNNAWSSPIDVPYHWAYGCGPGNYTTVSGVTTTPQLQNADPGVFTILFGSYFLEWQVADNVMRAVLCTSNYGLTCLWGKWNSLYFNKMAYGEPIGVCMRDMMGLYSAVERALMGDPSLRYHIVAPPSGLQVVSANGGVDLSWAASSEPVLGYHVYRAVNVTSEFTRVNTDLISGTAYHDPAPPEKCIYMVRAVTLTEGKSGSYFNASQGIFAQFETLSVPETPAMVSASDGVYNDKVLVTWNAAGYAVGYQIWRSVDNNPSAAEIIGESGMTRFEDLTAVTQTNYYYWIKAINSIGESAFSAADSGYSLMEIPAPPEGLTASDGTLSNKVAITWRASTQAMGYEIWRNLSNDPDSAALIGTAVTTNYDDVTAPADTLCYYWLKAVNAAGASVFSASDSGFRFTLGTPLVSASQGVYSNKIVVTWSAVPNALGYEIWRSESTYVQNALFLADTVLTNIEDTNVSLNTSYFYWVRATNAVGKGAFAGWYRGYGIPPPPPPQQVTASDGLYADKVVVTWGKVTNVIWSAPIGYKVWRSQVNDPATAEHIATTNGVGYTNYVDTSVELETPYYYWIKATNACGASEFSLSDSGYRSMNCAPASPSSISASYYTYTNKIVVTWTAVTNATGYELWRNTNSVLANATLLTSTANTTFDDTTALKDNYYYYWVRSTNVFGMSSFNGPATGIYKELLKPSLPAWVKASHGTYTDKVEVAWAASSDASGYAVYFTKPSDVLFNALSIYAMPGNNYVDMNTNIEAGRLYCYRIVPTNEMFGATIWSTYLSDFGWKAGISPSAPSNVYASAGVFTDRVEISWSATGATYYQVYRSISNESISTLGFQTSLTHVTDTNVVAGVSYSYWVSAQVTMGQEYISSNVVGWSASLSPPAGTLQLSASSASINENGGTVMITVTRTGGSDGAATVNYATVGGTAMAGSDYTTASGTLSWADGDAASKTFTVSITDDSSYEGNETFTVSLSGVSGASLSSPSSSTVTITDNESPPAGSIGLSTSTLTYARTYGSVTPSNQTLVLTNSGQAGFRYSNTVNYGSGSGWFMVAPVTGQVAGNASQVMTGTVSSAGLIVGVYVATNTIHSPDATNSPQYLVVTLTVSKATASVILGNLSQVYDGSSKAATATTIPSGLPVTMTYNGSATAPSAVGSYAVTAVVNSAMYQGSASGILTIGKSAQAITFPAISAQLTTNLVSLAATASSGLPMSFTVASGSAQITGGILSFTGAGSVSIVATQGGNATWNAATPVTNTFTVTKASATVTLGNLSQTYDGSAKSATATTAPSGLSVTLTYNGSATAPSAAGSYAVTAIVNSTIYQGFASGILTIGNGRPPSIPTGVSASDGIYANKVMVYWTALSSATSYKVWRGIDNNSQNASMLGTVTASFYLDTSTTPDVLYYYWIQAVDVTGTSDLSISDSGYCGSIVNLPSPAGVQASDGSYTDRIRITWQAVSSATRYEVWRNTENNRSAASLISDMTGTSYDDYSISPGICYYYWLKARTAHRDGNFSESDAGWCRLNTLSGVSASDGTYPYHIRVVWNVVANAAWYEVWREEVPGSNSDGGNLTKVAQTGDLYFNDYYTKSGVYYNYKVKACNELGSSLDYGHDTGYRQMNAASSLLPALNDYDGDKLSDLALFNSSAGVLDVLCSALGRQIFALGAEINDGSSGDLDGDGLDDPVAYCTDSGTWLVSLSSIGYTPVIQASFGGHGNTVATADYDGDGLADLTTYNETDGVLSVMLSNGGTYDRNASYSLGGPGYRPVSADYDGDGLADPAVYSEFEGRLTVMFSGNEYSSANVALGGQGKAMSAADFDGDGLADPVLYEQITGIWTILLSSIEYRGANILFGGPGYVPAIGDYDGDGLADPAIYRQSDGQWLIMLSGSGYTVIGETFGAVGLKLAGR